MSLNSFKYKGELPFLLVVFVYRLGRWLKFIKQSDKQFILERFNRSQGYNLNLENPKTLNEKINWLKLNFSHKNETIFADKFAIRDFVKKSFGDEYLIPLVYETRKPSSIKPEIFPDYPVIVKANHDSGSYRIIRDKNSVDWSKLQTDCRFWLTRNYYWVEREKQYKNIVPRIIIEKLLITKDGKIPFDFKLNCINGKVEFIYVSVDREGDNKRNIYDRNWNPLNFTWAGKNKDVSKLRGPEIPPPVNLDRMIEIAEKIASEFYYVRIDFYDVDGKIYFGEITQHHGGGFDCIRPFEWDLKFGEMLNLKSLNEN
jgi:hypothetical protein